MKRCLPFTHKYSHWKEVPDSKKDIYLRVPESTLIFTYQVMEEKVCRHCGKRKTRKMIG